MNDKQHNEELSNLAPKLASIEKKELHKSPEGYFDGLADVVLSKIKEAPVLFSLEKKEINDVPEGYFENVDDRIKSIVSKSKSSKIIPLRTKVLRWSAVAASICILVVSAYFLFGDTKNEGQKIASTVNTTNEEYTNYLMDELQDDELYAFVSENETAANTNDAVVDYLIDESSDFEFENIE